MFQSFAHAARVHYGHLQAVESGQHADGSASGQNIGQHLTSDFLRVDTDALTGHAVISGGHHDNGRVHPKRRLSAGHEEQTTGHILQNAETPPGFGQLVEMGSGPIGQRDIHGTYGIEQRTQGIVHTTSQIMAL